MFGDADAWLAGCVHPLSDGIVPATTDGPPFHQSVQLISANVVPYKDDVKAVCRWDWFIKWQWARWIDATMNSSGRGLGFWLHPFVYRVSGEMHQAFNSARRADICFNLLTWLVRWFRFSSASRERWRQRPAQLQAPQITRPIMAAAKTSAGAASISIRRSSSEWGAGADKRRAARFGANSIIQLRVVDDEVGVMHHQHFSPVCGWFNWKIGKYTRKISRQSHNFWLLPPLDVNEKISFPRGAAVRDCRAGSNQLQYQVFLSNGGQKQCGPWSLSKPT
jgi:hypothetical protein